MTFALLWSLAGSAFAQAVAPPPPLIEPGTTFRSEPPPKVGSCVGGDCGGSRARGLAVPRPRSSGRLAFSAAIFGAVSAALSLGGAIAIAVVDDPDSEIITRSVWFGYVAVSPPIVAFSAYRARRQRGVKGVPSARRLGWVAYSAVISQGVLQLALAARDYDISPGFTIAAGGFGALALLPHAFDALACARGARTAAPRAVIRPSLTGLHVQF